MKKTITYLLLCLLLLTVLVLPVSAKSGQVLDYAVLMSTDEAVSLADHFSDFRNSYGLDIVILTVPNLMNTPIDAFADDFYDNNGYGEDGLLFLLDIDSRQWYISTSGRASDMLSDGELEKIGEKVVPYFSKGQYYEGFDHFLDILPGYLDIDKEGGINLLLSLFAGAGIAGIALLVMRSTMNSKNPQRSAAAYTVENSYHLRQHLDLFLYSNVTKRAKPKNDSSDSSTHRSSSGRTHGGRGGSF